MNFPGCLLIVSHDRYFLDRLVDHLFVFEDNGHIRDFPGNYTDYRNFLAENKESNAGNGKQSNNQSPLGRVAEGGVGFVQTVVATSKRKLSFKEQKELENLEADMARLEVQKATVIEKLNTGSQSHEEITKWAKEIEQLNATLEEKEMRWLELSE